MVQTSSDTGGDIEARLASLQESLRESGAILEEHGRGLEADSALLTTSFQSLVESGTELSDVLQNVAGEFDTSFTNVQDTFSTAQASLEEGLESIEGFADGLQERWAAAEESVEALVANLEGVRDDAVELIDAAKESVDEFFEAQEALQEKFEGAGAALESAAKEQVEKLEASVEGAVERTRGLAESIVGEHRDASLALLGTLVDTVKQAENSTLAEALDTADELVSSIFDGFDQDIGDQAQRWQSAAEQALGGVAENVADQIATEVKEGLQRVIEVGIQTMVEEVAEQIIMMTFGTQTTASLSPVLPELVVAKKLVESINDFLEAMESVGL